MKKISSGNNLVLPPFHDIRRINLVKIQSLLSLTKYIEINIIHSTEHYENIFYGGSIDIDLELQM